MQMHPMTFTKPIAFLIAVLFLAAAPQVHADETAGSLKAAEEIVAEAAFTAEKLRNNSEFSPYVKGYMKSAKAVMIFPEILKGGFFIGGEGGTGVLLARADDGTWSYPAFFGMGAASFGLQFGAQTSELMLLIMTGDGLEAILENNVKIGGDISGALGPYGAGAEASTTANLNADVIAYSVAKGAFVGFSIEGAAIFPREKLDQAFYGDGNANARSVVIDGKFANPLADPVRGELDAYPR